MEWGFVLVTLYIGPLVLLCYVLAEKEPRPSEHEAFTSPLWKQGVGSTIHCVAGDATGIILAAAVNALLGRPMWIDLIVKYSSDSPLAVHFPAALHEGDDRWQLLEQRKNVKKSLLPELISGNTITARWGRS